MVIAYHINMTAYGWWLPNDLRGSTSKSIQCDVLEELGELHFGRKRVQPASRDIRAFYERAADLLKHELLTFNDDAIQIIATAFANCIRANGYTCYACAIMIDHVHLLIRKHKHLAKQMIEQFQSYSGDALQTVELRPPDHPVWASGGWKVFLDEPAEIWRTNPYIEDNPIKMRRPAQSWPL
jgi:REP element-mobilizing transposase RayT